MQDQDAARAAFAHAHQSTLTSWDDLPSTKYKRGGGDCDPSAKRAVEAARTTSLKILKSIKKIVLSGAQPT